MIAPLWKNSTASYFPEPRWFPTDVLNTDDLYDQCPGELHVYTKTVSEEVPGYILIDYDITFRGLSINPKTGLLPISRIKYTQVTLSTASQAVTLSTTTVAFNTNVNNLLDGTTISSSPPGAAIGDVYKVIFDEDDASFTNVTAATMLRVLMSGGTSQTESFTDGFTCYALYSGSNIMTLYPGITGARISNNPFTWGVTATVTVSLPCYMSLVGSFGGLNAQASI
jgi:hypothetical protein